MTLTRGMQVFTAILLAVCCTTAYAGDGDVAKKIDQLEKTQNELKAEMAQVNATLQAILAELKQADKNPSIDVSTQLRAISAQLKQIQQLVAQGSKPQNKRKADTTVYDVKIGNSPVRGPANAKVTITEFVDFQCPYCTREWPKIKKVLQDYPNDVKVVFKHYPLPFHKKAKPIHAASELARRQLGNDGFWRMHDMIVSANLKTLDNAGVRAFAEQLGMNLAELDAVMADQAQQDSLLDADKKEAAKCGVRGTPTVLINGLKMADRSPQAYKDRIDAILKQKDGGMKGNVKVTGPGADKVKIRKLDK